MPFRFRRSIRLAPGIRLNIIISRRGARATLGHGLTRAVVAAPDTGLSYTATAHRRAAAVVTVVLWGAQLLGTAVVLALLFMWAAGWL
jgi:hypothetical protein